MSTPALIPTEKRRLQELAASHIVADYQDYRDKAIVDGDVTDMRQLVDLQMRLIGAEMEKKANANDGLAVFHFHMSTGEAPMEFVQEVPKEPEALPEPWPFKDVVVDATPVSQEPPIDADTLLQGLDDMLAGAVPLDD